MSTNHALAVEGRTLLTEALQIAPPCPDHMIGAMAAVPLPAAAAAAPVARLDREALATWFREQGVETWIAAPPFRILRLSVQLYNDIDEVRRLTALLREALDGSAGAG
jgi:isopenicillin-N epimerase